MSSPSFSVHYAALPALKTEVLKIMAIAMTYAFSQEALENYYDNYYCGGFRFLENAFFETPKRMATRALIELAIMYRALDDAQNITKGKSGSFGELHKPDGAVEELPLREVANKIIHADKIDWDFEDHLKDPLIVCHAAANQIDRFKWTKATIPVSALARACAGFVNP